MKTGPASVSLIHIVLVLVISAGCAGSQHGENTHVGALHRAPFSEAVFLGRLENRGISEASGIAASRLHPGVLWIVNDGGDVPVLYAVGMRGAHIGRVRIRNARNVDWEDLAAFRVGNDAILLIADVGDNHARRKQCDLYFVHEPNIVDLPDRFELSVNWHRHVRFVYEDGPRNCEAVAVDPQGNQILLLTKQSSGPVLYTLPLNAEKEPPLMVARRVGVVDGMAASAKDPLAGGLRFKRWRSQPTAMDISPTGSEIVVLTYENGYLYRRPGHLDWPQVFQQPPEIIGLPSLRQAEAICFSANGRSLIITSEQVPAPLYRLDRHSSSTREAIP